MSTLVLLLFTGLGLGALYFLVASGLSLIYGLMGVLNFAHGSFLTLSAFAGFEVGRRLGYDTVGGFFGSIVIGAVVGGLFAAATELLLIRPLYKRHIEQLLVTVGLSLATVALFEGIWGPDPSSSRRAAGCARPPRCSAPASPTTGSWRSSQRSSCWAPWCCS